MEKSEQNQSKTLLSWEGASRPFRKKNKTYYLTTSAIIILLILIAFVIQHFLLIATLLAFSFVVYVLAFVPPQDIDYKISTSGITIGERFYLWKELDSFWFKEKEGHQVMIVKTRLKFPAQLLLVLKDHDQENLKKTVSKYLPFYEIPRTTLLDRWTESLQKNFPLDNFHKS